jgi:heptosyltransferase III
LHILVIRPGAIGDALLTFPVLKALREHYSGTHITLVSNAHVLPLALAFGITEEVSDYQAIQWSELFSPAGIHIPALQELLGQTDLAICWLRDPGGFIEHNLKTAGIKCPIITPGRPPEGARVHIVAYLAQTAGLSIAEAQWTAPSLDTHAGARGDYVAIHPGSGGAQKCWPLNRFVTVIERLWQQNRPVLLLAGPADAERLRDLRSLLAAPPRPEMLRLLINVPLLEVAQHLQQCGCYLGNDSGITHLAAMLGAPTVAIFGPSDPAVWRPVGPCVKVIHKDVLEHVSVDAVMGAINE